MFQRLPADTFFFIFQSALTIDDFASLSCACKDIATVSASKKLDETKRKLLWRDAIANDAAAFMTERGRYPTATCCALSPDGARVLAGSDRNDNLARLWSAETGELLKQFQGHTDRVTCCAISLGGAWAVTGSDDSTARIWDMETGDSLLTLEGHPGGRAVLACAFSHEGTAREGTRVFTRCYEMYKIWDASTGAMLVTRMNDDYSGVFHTCVISPDDTRVATAKDERYPIPGGWQESGFDVLEIWDTATGDALMTLSGHKSTIVCYLFSPDYHGQNEGIIVTAGAKRRDGFHDIDDCWTGVATIWDAETGAALHTLEGLAIGRFTSCDFSPMGLRVVTAGEDKMARIWCTRIGVLLNVLTGHNGALGHPAALWICCFSPDGARVATAVDDSIQLWNAETGKKVKKLKRSGHDWVRDHTISFTPDGTRVLARDSSGRARIWGAPRRSRLADVCL
ncbi:F-box and WD-40 domain protein [Aureococcus anophagefferens]|uniref:F-box and WD-40 domain protein n=1 Tax=Aureococcus anophagefferens TaxID=44056 RepID=A0ABR1FRL9_AURAN